MINKIKKLITQLKCHFGYHKWNYDTDTIVKCNRTCNSCDTKEHSVYDMSYGNTVWHIGHYW